MNYRVEIEFSDEDGQEPFTEKEIVEALYHGEFPSQRNAPKFIDIKEVQVHRYRGGISERDEKGPATRGSSSSDG